MRTKKAKAAAKLTYNKMLFHCWTGCSTVMYRQDVNNKIYGPVISNCEDYALFLEVLRHNKNAHGLAQCLTKYRIRGNSLSGNKFKKPASYFDLMLCIEHKSIFAAVFTCLPIN